MDSWSPYHPERDAQTLRDWLKILSKNGFGAKRLIQEMETTGWMPANLFDRLERPSVSRFMGGGKSDRPVFLAALWDYLHTEDRYARLFPPVGLSGKGFQDFFDEDPYTRHAYSIPRLQAKLPGRYAMYRHAMMPERKTWLPVSSRMESGVRICRIDISLSEQGLNIEETSADYPREFSEDDPDNRRSHGFLAPFGPYVFFQMRGHQATSLNSGIIQLMEPYQGDGRVDWFRGTIQITDQNGIFPVVRFFCERSDAVPRVMSEEELEVPGAVEWILPIDTEPEIITYYR